jgi:tetratricopeptide (TPR) repeat protein
LLTSLPSLLSRIRAESGLAPWLREVARACLAFGLYVAFGALDVGTKVGKHYWSGIAVVTHPVLSWTQHFRNLPQVTQVFPGNQHSHLVLIAALFLVSWRLPLWRRLSCFGMLAGLAFVQDCVAAGLSLRLHEAKALFEQRGWLMLLPWEYNTFDTLWYLIYAVPLQAAPFLLFFLTASWNSGVRFASFVPGSPVGRGVELSIQEFPPPQRSLPRRALVPNCVAVFLAGSVLVGAGVWARIRERDPLHLKTHLYLGNLHFSEGKLQEAAVEYRHMVAMRPIEGEAWLRLAQVQYDLGKREEAVRILQRGAGTVEDGPWVDRIRAGLKDLGSSDPQP